MYAVSPPRGCVRGSAAVPQLGLRALGTSWAEGPQQKLQAHRPMPNGGRRGGGVRHLSLPLPLEGGPSPSWLPACLQAREGGQRQEGG